MMGNRIIYKIIIALLAISILSVCFYVVYSGKAKTNKYMVHNAKAYGNLQNVGTWSKGNRTEKLFLYLLQVKECLWDYHLKKENLGEENILDILVLSYMRECKKPHPPHITYINVNGKTTWSSGRNILYGYIAEHSLIKQYLYFIFCDEDIHLIDNTIYGKEYYTDEALQIIYEKISPYRKFERFLQDYRPAIGSIDNHKVMRMIYGYIMRKKLKFKPYNSNLLFDGQYNGYHRDIITEMLPYDTSYDHINWWVSQMHQQCKMFYRYHGLNVMFLPIIATNSEHSPYPTGPVPSFSEICNSERLKAPKHMRDPNHELAKKWFTLPLTSPQRILVYDYVAPPRTPFKKYVYFNGNFSGVSLS